MRCNQRAYCIRLNLNKEEHKRVNSYLNRIGNDGENKTAAFIRAMLFYLDSAESGIPGERTEDRFTELEERIRRIEEQLSSITGREKDYVKPEHKKKAAGEHCTGLDPEDEEELGEIARGFM